MENATVCPARKAKVNYDWSDVQTTKFEAPVNDWGPVQTSPVGKGVITTKYEKQGSAWGPVQTTRYSAPVVWDPSKQSADTYENMALRHQVFGRYEIQFYVQD